jgi:hypothetical protein
MSKIKKPKSKKEIFEESKLEKIRNIFSKFGNFLIKYEYKIWQIIYDFSLVFIAFSFSILLLSQINRLIEWYYLAVFTILFIVIVYIILKRIESLKK